MSRHLEQPVALVTGAGRGIGAGIASALSDEGYAVALTSRSRDQLEETAGRCTGPTLVLPADLTAPGAIEGVVDQLEQEWAAPQVVVANAGAGVSASVDRTTDEQWQQMLDLNLTAPFRLLRRTIPAMKQAGHGRIVVVASVAAKVGEPYISAYTASKHGVLGLVRSAAAELARTGVTVNAVCPGYVDTPMTAQTVRGIVDKTGRTPEQALAALEAKSPLHRLITVDEVVEAVLTCLRNGGMSGQGINVDGGALQS
ncbi:SDR family NAD(P)-dependent oxidoreductase [Ornithinimicrobium sufpigmenti]|uniref:SDR family NAD(P)-dependent oxidoreductase n=1 Tax=Ornithinimicrobium sufpigmenti TaxID=2508882 RepID=UPI00192DDE0C|nr:MULTISPECIES: SDR family NAD(P)-dependent oxidoreductase [unclassified Ornithinimicrobium]